MKNAIELAAKHAQMAFIFTVAIITFCFVLVPMVCMIAPFVLTGASFGSVLGLALGLFGLAFGAHCVFDYVSKNAAEIYNKQVIISVKLA